MLHWLAEASEAGISLRNAMAGIHEFEPYKKDPRIDVIIHNARSLRNKEVAVSDPVPTLDSSPTLPR